MRGSAMENGSLHGDAEGNCTVGMRGLYKEYRKGNILSGCMSVRLCILSVCGWSHECLHRNRMYACVCVHCGHEIDRTKQGNSLALVEYTRFRQGHVACAKDIVLVPFPCILRKRSQH